MRRWIMATLALAILGGCSGAPTRREPEPEQIRYRARKADQDLDREERKRND